MNYYNKTLEEIYEELKTSKDGLTQKEANNNLNKWTITRLGFTDQAILRLAIYELIYTDTPDVVVINEAIELAKLYSDDDVRKMINGTLDKIYHDKVDHEQ